MIDSAGTQELGRSLTSDELESLSEEQKVQVLKIAEETVKAAPDSTWLPSTPVYSPGLRRVWVWVHGFASVRLHEFACACVLRCKLVT